VTQVLTFAIAVVAFLAVYAVLHKRHARISDTRQPVQWGWIAAIIGLAIVAILAGALLG